MPKRPKWRKSKPAKDQPPTEQADDQGAEEPRNAQVVVASGIKIDLVNDLRQQHKTEHYETAAYNKKQLLWTKVTAGLVFIYAGLTFWQACETRNLGIIAGQQLVSDHSCPAIS
jgi:hypothetical protein